MPVSLLLRVSLLSRLFLCVSLSLSLPVSLSLAPCLSLFFFFFLSFFVSCFGRVEEEARFLRGSGVVQVGPGTVWLANCLAGEGLG